MKLGTRLALVAVVIIGSACYAILIAKSPELGRTVALGYIAILLTILVTVNLWKVK